MAIAESWPLLPRPEAAGLFFVEKHPAGKPLSGAKFGHPRDGRRGSLPWALGHGDFPMKFGCVSAPQTCMVYEGLLYPHAPCIVNLPTFG